jgi:hypothetical protein
MTEKTEDQASEDPAPTKESDANRVTQEEAEDGPAPSDEGREEGSASEAG